ncbi:MAG TPA: type II toxin-antitoxin system prevent-host-death family antitoxin [Candidatus Bathyarchaeia archaeon]|nr:type II toxin-antitoxin system prevent-host-death family antitoxin [Candidatus Bathyarchaeia archaeon]
METVAISNFRSNLPTFISQVEKKLKRFVVAVSGKPKAVVMSLEELESLEETAEVLSIPDALKSIKEARRQIRKGKYITLKKLEKKYQL